MSDDPAITRSRAEHVRWCKQRALEFLQAGDIEQALTSMMSDLGKHDETKQLARDVGPLYVFALRQHSAHEARKFIEGFAE